MKNIMNLMKLDFIALKSKMLPLVLICLVLSAMISIFVLPHFVYAFLITSAMILQPMFIIAEKNGFNKLYGILPVKRTEIVAARFILGFIIIVVSAVILTIIGYIGTWINIAGRFPEETAMLIELNERLKEMEFTLIDVAGMMFVLACFMGAVEYAILFILGTSKEIIGVICATAFLGIVMIPVSMLVRNHGNKVVEILEFFIKHPYILILIELAVGVLLMYIGYLISAKFFKKKEL